MEPGLPRLMSCSSLGMEAVAALGDSQGAQDGSYSPQEALELALRDWVAEINQQALEPGRQWICMCSIPQSLECWIGSARSLAGTG